MQPTKEEIKNKCAIWLSKEVKFISIKDGKIVKERDKCSQKKS